MTYFTGKPLCDDAIGLRLIRYDRRGRAHFSERVVFTKGRPAVISTLNRAALAGRVEIEGTIQDHQADVLIDDAGGWEQVVALDAKSYKALKHHWMRCKTETVE